MEEKKDYQDAYEKEHYKAVYLANRVAELEDQVDDCLLYTSDAEKLRQPVGCDCKGAL